jgi:hypothetical protein
MVVTRANLRTPESMDRPEVLPAAVADRLLKHVLVAGPFSETC